MIVREKEREPPSCNHQETSLLAMYWTGYGGELIHTCARSCIHICIHAHFRNYNLMYSRGQHNPYAQIRHGTEHQSYR